MKCERTVEKELRNEIAIIILTIAQNLDVVHLCKFYSLGLYQNIAAYLMDAEFKNNGKITKHQYKYIVRASY